MDTEKVKKWCRYTLGGMNHLLWPVVCSGCGGSALGGDNNLCKKCAEELLVCTGGDYCRRCGKDASRYAIINGGCPDCQGTEIYFDGIARGGVYKGALQRMILSFKNGRTELDTVLGFLGNSALEGSGFTNEIELFVPVPLHWTRRLIRGYNQSHIIAGKIRHPSAKINSELVRIRRTRSQPTMASAAARARNVAGAFGVRRGHSFGGRKVCLVDDIKTTGATLNECAKTLKQAGASKVFSLVLAVAGQRV